MAMHSSLSEDETTRFVELINSNIISLSLEISEDYSGAPMGHPDPIVWIDVVGRRDGAADIKNPQFIELLKPYFKITFPVNSIIKLTEPKK